nr:P3 [Bipolaris maydis partitivirus 1]
MSFHFDEAIPPARKQPTNKSLRGRISTAYEVEAFSFNVQEPTPKMSQDEFPDVLSPRSSPPDYPQSQSGPSYTGKGKAPANTSTSISGTLPFQISSPPRSRRTSDDTTPKPSPTRRDSIPIRKPRVSVDHKPLTVSCESCKSKHSVSISEADRALVLSCDVVPPPPTPTPTVLELYKLPGYLKINQNGQIVVSTESELLSYVRKIFTPADIYRGDFPSSRHSYIDELDSLGSTSVSSTPEAYRESYALGHSKYLGTFCDPSTEPPTPAVMEKETVAKREKQASETTSRSPSRGPLEPYAPPVVSHGNKPIGYRHPSPGQSNPIAFVQEVRPTSPAPPPPSSPKHATAARQASPRNLRPIGIFSDSESDLPIPVKSESISIRIGSARHSRSSSQPGSLPAFDPPTRQELYNQATEISSELSSSRESSTRPDRNYYVQPREPSPRGRNPSRR